MMTMASVVFVTILSVFSLWLSLPGGKTGKDEKVQKPEPCVLLLLSIGNKKAPIS